VAFPKLRLFRTSWWTVNLLLALSVSFLLYSCVWEFSVRRYLDGFSDAIVPNAAPPEMKVEAILNWMRNGANRVVASDPQALAHRDPETTLVYQQLLRECGTATNAFLNLGRSSDLQVRRLLLLGPDSRAMHVVAEVLLDGRWVVVDPGYRTMMRNKQGHPLTRAEMRDPATFAEATQGIPNYSPDYTYDRIAHVRLARMPLDGFHLRRLLNFVYPGWEESFDWSLFLERESYAALVASIFLVGLFLFLRFSLGWYGDRRLRAPRSHLRESVLRAGAALLSNPEIK
jgi:Transglutaminase-like superfamily